MGTVWLVCVSGDKTHQIVIQTPHIPALECLQFGVPYGL